MKKIALKETGRSSSDHDLSRDWTGKIQIPKCASRKNTPSETESKYIAPFLHKINVTTSVD